jgi:hypothetical protein
MAQKNYDTRCYDLAEVFLGYCPDIDTEEKCDELAVLIQRTIEDQIASWSANANEAAYDREQERLMEGGGPPGLLEQQQVAHKIKRGLR